MNNEQKVQNQHVSQHSSNEMLAAANCLIAEFMGGTKGRSLKEGVFYYFPNHIPSYLISELKYNSQWDWLMPVVEQIEKFGITVVIDGNNCYWYEPGKINQGMAGYSKSKIDAVWIAVVKYIEWFNKQNAVKGSS